MGIGGGGALHTVNPLSRKHIKSQHDANVAQPVIVSLRLRVGGGISPGGG